MSNPIDAMLQQLKLEHPDLFSRDPLVRPAGLVAIRFADPNASAEAPSTDNAIVEILKNVGVYTTVDDYLLLDVPRETRVALRHELINDIVKRVDQRDLLLSLKSLAIATGSQDKTENLVSGFSERLPAPSRIRLERTLKETDRVFLYRQQVLAAFREVIIRGQSVNENQMHPLDAAILLSHAMLDAEDVLGDTDSQIGRLPATLSVHLVANQDFNSTVDIIAAFDRAIRLWRDYGPRFTERLNDREPHEILKSQTGLDIEDVLAMAFGVWSYDLRWNPVNPTPLTRTLNPNTSIELVTAFMRSMSASLDDLAEQILVQRSDWDFLPFEMRPIIDLEDGWLLVDVAFLMDRVTSGLFYVVFDHLKSIDEGQALEWSRIWGDMVEALVRDNVTHLVQLPSGGSRPMYSQDHLKDAYPKGGGRADILVVFDATVVAFEVVSGRLKVETRLGLDQNAFNDDLERIVYKKLRQLNGTATNILNDPARLFGDVAQLQHFQPVVVTAGGFPFNIATSRVIDDHIAAKGLFTQQRVLPAAVIDLSELEMMEALAEDGESVADLIRQWKASPDRQFSFRNWIIKSRGSARARPQRMDAPIHELIISFSRRLNISDDDAPSPGG